VLSVLLSQVMLAMVHAGGAVSTTPA
jgi:hypothetical protein